MSLGALAFLNPWLLAGAGRAAGHLLAAAHRPAAARARSTFPPTRILVGLENREKTPAKTPWWLTLHPHAGRRPRHPGAGRAGAQSQPRDGARRAPARSCSSSTTAGRRPRTGRERTRMIERLIAEAEAQSRPVVIVPTASADQERSASSIEAPAAARSTAAALQPQPFAPDRMARAAAHSTTALARAPGDASIVWLSRRHRPRRQGARVCRPARGARRAARFAVVETRPGQEALGAVGRRRPAAASSKRRCCAPRAARATARCMPSRRAASASARRRSRSAPARRDALAPSTCRSSSATR